MTASVPSGARYGVTSMVAPLRRVLVRRRAVHVAVDDYSRAAYVEVLPDQTGATTAGFLRRTLRWFARHGVLVRRVLTDNGSGYLSRRFQQVAQAVGDL